MVPVVFREEDSKSYVTVRIYLKQLSVLLSIIICFDLFNAKYSKLTFNLLVSNYPTGHKACYDDPRQDEQERCEHSAAVPLER